MKAERLNKPVKSGGSTKKRIEEMRAKYGTAVELVQNVDRSQRSMTIHKPDHNRMVFWLALAGMTEYEMANTLGISHATLEVWKNRRPDFLAALQAGRTEAVGKAAHTLFEAGNGWSHQAEKLIPNRVKVYSPLTGKLIEERTEILRVPYTKQYPPNVQALLKFLAAKHPEMWGDRSEVHHTGSVNHAIDATKLSKKKLKMLQSIAQSSAKDTQKEVDEVAIQDNIRINAGREEEKAKKAAKKDKKKAKPIETDE